MEELKSVTATHAQKEEMIDILRRLHVQAAEQEGSGGPSDGKSSSSDEGGLSEATVHRLLAKVGAACLASRQQRPACISAQSDA